MPKKQNLDARFMDWADGAPPEIVERFLNSHAAEEIVNSGNYHSGMTKAQQRAAELEAQVSETVELKKWAQQHSDLYAQMPEWAPIMRAHRAEEVNRAFNTAKKEIEQQAEEVETAYREGRLSPDEAVPIVMNLQKRYGAINEQIEGFKTFREQEVPRLVAAVEENFKNLNGRLDNNTRMSIQLMADVQDYVAAHPGRSSRKLMDTFVERNPERHYKTFDEVASDAYGEADTEQLIEQRTAERLAAQQKERTEAGRTEAPVTGSALGPFRRHQAPITPVPATTQGQVRTNLLEHFQKQ